MNILTICYEYPPLGGGGSPVCEGLCESLVTRGHHVDLVTSQFADLPVEEQRNGVNIHRTRCLRRHVHYTTTLEMLSGILPAMHKAVELSGNTAYDLVHCHFIVPSGLVSYLLATKTGLPYLITVHGSDVPGYNPDRFGLAHRLIRPVWKRIVRSSRSIVTPTTYMGNLLKTHADPREMEVIPNGIHLPERGPAQPKNRIMMVSRIFERKGVDVLLRAYAELDTDWELVIAGDGPYLKAAKALAGKLGVTVHFLGHVDKTQLPALYESARIFVLPSSRENFPVVLLEALKGGCAIITTKGSGCSEVVGEAGLLVEPGSARDLANALAGLLADEQRIETLRQQSLQHIREFSWERIAARYEEHYRRILRQPRQPP